MLMMVDAGKLLYMRLCASLCCVFPLVQHVSQATLNSQRHTGPQGTGVWFAMYILYENIPFLLFPPHAWPADTKAARAFVRLPGAG